MKKLIIIFTICLLSITLQAADTQNCCTKQQSLVGQKAPEFTAKGVIADAEGHVLEEKEISLSDYKNRFKVIFFYPYDFSQICPGELQALETHLKEFEERDAQILAISTDSIFAHKKWLEASKEEVGIKGITYPVLSDPTRSIACKYGVLDPSGFALRGAFIIDGNNIVQSLMINSLDVGRNIKEILRLIDVICISQEKTGGSSCIIGLPKKVSNAEEHTTK